ncbi:MAG: tetratricopeptide repeat protein [Dehalococcoidia bacterium]
MRLLETDPAAAEARFRDALAKGPSADAIVGLASLLKGRGETEEASALLDRAPADRRAKVMKHRIFLDDFAARHDESELRAEVGREPSSPRARYRWGVMLAARGRHQDALDELLESVRLDRDFADGAARKAVLAVFDLLGLDSPATREYQRKLSMLLF